MNFGIKFILTLFLCTGESRKKAQPQYGKDFFLFPKQDGSNNIVPAFLTKDFTKESQATVLSTKNDVHFYLYTTKNRDSPTELLLNDFENLANSNFLRNHDLKILCHGFTSSYLDPFPANTKTKYLDTYEDRLLNVIVIDWSLLALAPFYIEAVEHVSLVGELTGKLITFLVDEQFITLDKIHFIGHSLGAHIGGVAGRYVLQFTGTKLPRVTGLDPAAPLVENTALSINSKVAKFVDIIHTSAELLGISYPVGVADFYPNGGFEQNGCVIDTFGQCSHTRAHEYFLESIIPLDKKKFKFESCACANCTIRDDICYQEMFLTGECNCKRKTSMGEAAGTALPGLYFLDTNPTFPFSKT